MNKNLIFGSVLLGLTIIFVVVVVVLVRAKQTDSKTEDDCNAWQKDSAKLKDGDSCSVWDSNQCRKGIWNLSSKNCVSKGSVWPLILLILALACFIASIVFFVKSRNS
jgi:hypothetical protein